jgi:hypothetical protein
MEIKIAHLHNPLFFAGKNFGQKLDPGKTAGLKLEFDEKRNWLVVNWENKQSYVPVTNISAMEAGTPEKYAQQVTHPIVAGIVSAQVETPYGHVHAGPGAGKTGK